MRKITVLGLGIYYKQGSPNASNDADWMRKFCYAVKGEYPPAFPATYPGQMNGAWIGSSHDAASYAALCVSSAWNWNLKEKPQLVPVPSSVVTQQNWSTARWGGLEFAKALEKHGVGDVCVAVVNSLSVPKMSKGGRGASEIVRNYVPVSAVDKSRPVILVDDVSTWGASMAAMDFVIKAPVTCGIVVGLCTGTHFSTAIGPCRRVISYDPPNLDEVTSSEVTFDRANG